MSRPLVSVCMPCFNAERYLPAALDSVLAQTYRPLEIVCVNDGSRDRTGEILDDYSTRHGVRVLHQDNQGQSAAVNRAFENCSGDFIKFFDADDLISPDLIELQVQRLLADPLCVASAQWARFHENPAEANFRPEAVWRDMPPLDWLIESLLSGQNMMQCAIWLFPRKVLERSGTWDPRLGLINDVDFVPRALLASQGVRFTAGKLYYRSGLPGSLSGRKSRNAYESAALAVNKFTDTLTAFEDSPRVRRVCADLLQAYYFEIAPQQPDLGEQLRSRAIELGGSDVQPSGGPVFQTLRRLIGWRAASRLRSLGQARGYAALRQRLAGLRNASRTQSHSSAEGAAG